MTITERRRFIAKAGGALAVAAAAAITDAPNVVAQPKVQWRMSTAFQSVLDVHQGAAERFAKIVEQTSGGRFHIEVFPAGQIMRPFECFEAASKGTVEAFMGNSYYWTNQTKEPAVEWFSTVPFGMNPEGMFAWMYQGDGLKLWEETYARFNLVPRPGPAVAPQMAGWFRKKINTLADLLLLRAGGSVAQAAEVTNLRLKGDSATALFQAVDPSDPCLENFVSVSFADELEKISPPGSQTPAARHGPPRRTGPSGPSKPE